MLVKAGDTDVTTYFAMRLTADGKAATGLTITGFDLQYVRSGVAPVAKVDATALVATDSDHADNKAFEIDATDQPGLYRVDWPDEAFATGVREVVLSVKVATAFTEHLRVELNAPVDVVAVSGDATAADNLELQYDTTGLTGDEFPATQAQVGKIGSSSGGSLSFAAEIDNAITDTIDNAAAVNKGSGLVGIPITGHAFTADFQVTIASTTNYNGSFTVISKTTNEIVITATFVSETFGGTETCVATIKTIAKIGTLTSGTFTSTEAQDTIHQVLTNASDNLDWAFQYDVGGGRTASKVVFFGYLTSNNDSMNIQAYDFVGTDWETRAVLSGTNQTTDQTLDISLLAKHTGTSGADIGKVLIRFVDATAAGHVLGIDLMLVEAVGIGQTVGYQLGAIWIDTDDGTAGTEPFVNGVADNPCLTLADAVSLKSSTTLHRFVVTPDSSITFAEGHVSEVWAGEGFDLALNNKDCGGTHFNGPDVSGIATGSVEMHFDHCELGNMTVSDAHFDGCDIEGTVTLSAAANYNFVDCAHSGSSATIDFGSSVGDTTVHVHNYHGALTIKNMGQSSSTDILHFSSSNGKLTLDSTCIAGTVNLNGTFDLVNNGSGQTLNRDGDAVNQILSRAKGIAKNAAHNDIEFLMVDANDLATPETGLTVTGTRSIDGGSFSGVSGSIAEVANGIYQFDAVAADLNGEMITFLFEATGAAPRYLTVKTSS